MTTKTYALLDMPNLAHRGWHAVQNLEEGRRVSYAVLRDLVFLSGVLGTSNFVFCFDCEGRGVRARHYPAYKANRSHEGRHSSVNRQLDRLREGTLPAIGYANLFRKEEFEADDVIGSLVWHRPAGVDYIIVSNDQDYYQLLGPHVSIWNPHKKQTITGDGFRTLYKIPPTAWVAAKALAGCKTDNVKGVVGIDLAVRHLSGEVLSPRFDAKIKAAGDLITLNTRLVTLPSTYLPDVEFRLAPDGTSRAGWDEVVDGLGFPSLAGRGPHG